jgi:integrase
MVNRVYAHITALMNFAVDGEDQIITGHPFALKRRVRANVLFPERKKTRYLDPDEIRKVWHIETFLDYRSEGMGEAMQLILCTGQRPGEVLGMERGLIDEKKLMWTIPDPKNGVTQKVPLNRLAMAIIKERMEKVKGKYLFPHPTGRRAHDVTKIGAIARNLVEPSKGKPLGRLNMPKWTPHDLRRTVSTLMSMKEYGMSIPEKHISRILNHKMRTSDSGATMTAEVYNQNPYWEEKKDALEKWNDFLEGILGLAHNVKKAA